MVGAGPNRRHAAARAGTCGPGDKGTGGGAAKPEINRAACHFFIRIDHRAAYGVGEVVDAVLVGIAWWVARFAGLMALKDILASIVHAGLARTMADIDAAAGLFARGLVVLGLVFLAEIIRRAGDEENVSKAPERAEASSALPKTVRPTSNNELPLAGKAPNDPTGGIFQAAPPSYILGQSDGGPGTWTQINEGLSPAEARYQQAVTGAPLNTVYNVPNSSAISGVTSFDGYNPATNTLVDAKLWNNWPIPASFSTNSVLGQATSQTQAANGANIAWVVPSQTTAETLQILFETSNITGISLLVKAP